MSVNALWSVSDFFFVLEEIEKGGLKASFWRNEENWAAISDGENEVGYLWQKYPLAIILSNYQEHIEKASKELGYLVIVPVDDLRKETFCIDGDMIFNNLFDPTLNKESFSATDLWFSSVV